MIGGWARQQESKRPAVTDRREHEDLSASL
jgi:hypothetical protein